MNEASVRDELAAALRTVPSLSGRTYDWNATKVSPPAAVTDLPDGGEYHLAYASGMDSIRYQFMVVCGPVADRPSGDRLSAYVSGPAGNPESVRAAVEGFAYTACDDVTVQSWEPLVATFGQVQYLAVQFTAEATGRGT